MNTQILQTVKEFFSAYSSKKYKEGELLLSPGTPIHEVLFLNSGHVRQYLVSEQGVEVTIHIYEKGSTLPLIPVIHKRENEHYFDALSNCEVYAAPVKDFTSFLVNNPDVMYDTMSRLLLGLQGLIKRIEYLTLNKANARLAASLLYLARHFGSPDGAGIALSQRFTHHEIASIVGLARETVSLELEHMMSKGLIQYNGRYIVIPDISALELQVEL